MKKLKAIIVIMTLILAAAGFSSCTCENLIERAERKCGTLKRVDTITVYGSVTTTLTAHDTLFHFTHTKQLDTVILKENNLMVKFFYNTKDSLIYLNGKCDTLRVPYVVKVNTTVTEIFYSYFHKYERYFKIIFFSALFIALIIIFVKVYIRITTGKK